MVGLAKVKLERGAPIPVSYLSVFKLVGDCLRVDPRVQRMNRTLVYQLGSGQAFVGIGESKSVVGTAELFRFRFDGDAPVSFIREASKEVLGTARASERCLVLLAYLPTRARIVSKSFSVCQDKDVVLVPPLRDIEDCTPRSVGDTLSCRSMKDMGSVHVAVSPVFTYVLAGYRLILRGAPSEADVRQLAGEGS